MRRQSIKPVIRPYSSNLAFSKMHDDFITGIVRIQTRIQQHRMIRRNVLGSSITIQPRLCKKYNLLHFSLQLAHTITFLNNLPYIFFP